MAWIAARRPGGHFVADHVPWIVVAPPSVTTTVNRRPVWARAPPVEYAELIPQICHEQHAGPQRCRASAANSRDARSKNWMPSNAAHLPSIRTDRPIGGKIRRVPRMARSAGATGRSRHHSVIDAPPLPVPGQRRIQLLAAAFENPRDGLERSVADVLVDRLDGKGKSLGGRRRVSGWPSRSTNVSSRGSFQVSRCLEIRWSASAR